MHVRVPASSANLGPGFDALALALTLYLEVDLELTDALEVVTDGIGATGPDNDHWGVRVARQVLGHDHFRLTVRSTIPVARGLGSSAALAVACATAAGAEAPLTVAAEFDGHAENAAASFYGGLVIATMIDGTPVVESLPVDEELRFVVVVPALELATADARRVLPTAVPFADATFNLARLGLLVAGLRDHHHLRAEAMEDRLHQPYRASLLPFASGVLKGLRDAGALASCWSGAGSTMLGVATRDSADVVASAARDLLAHVSVPGEVHVLSADRTGLVRS